MAEADASALTKDSVTLAIQVNGKLRGTIEVAVSAGNDEIETLALAEPKVAEFVAGQTPKKIIVVPGKIVNIEPQAPSPLAGGEPGFRAALPRAGERPHRDVRTGLASAGRARGWDGGVGAAGAC